MSILRIILIILLWYVLTIQLPNKIVNKKGYKFVFFTASLVITSIMICIFFKEPIQVFVFKRMQTFVGIFKLAILFIVLLILLINTDRTKKFEENKKNKF